VVPLPNTEKGLYKPAAMAPDFLREIPVRPCDALIEQDVDLITPLCLVTVDEIANDTPVACRYPRIRVRGDQSWPYRY
jgi:hypothetical protein